MAVLPILVTLLPAQTHIEASPSLSNSVASFLEFKAPQFPDRTKEYQAAVIYDQQQAAVAEQARLDALEATRIAALSKPVVYTTLFVEEVVGTLTGSQGYSLAGGNCINELGVNNPGWGNPIDWPVINNSPWIGATVLFWFNHTAVVTGTWSNGDVEVRQQNSGGATHRYSMSSIRGFR